MFLFYFHKLYEKHSIKFDAIHKFDSLIDQTYFILALIFLRFFSFKYLVKVNSK